MLRVALVAALLGAFCLASGPALAADAPSGQKAEPRGEKVNINTATAEQLETLPGIGPALAQRILEYRKENGPFKKVEDLLNVKGIGEKSFLRLRDRIVVSS